jgi:branched-chain amino acid transport system permease protein
MAAVSAILRGIRFSWPVLSLALMLLVIVVLVWAFGGTILQRTATEALIRVVIVVGLYIFIGNSGVISFGSIAFMAIGAYATAWQTCCPRLKPLNMTGLPDFLRYNTIDLFPAAVSSSVLATVFALIIGYPIMRLSGISASIATLAVLAIINVTYANWDTVTLGTNSVVGIPRYVDVWIALGCAVFAMAIAYVYQESTMGRALRATRQDEVAAKAVGINVPNQRLIAWVLSAFFVALGGVLYAHFISLITVDVFYLDMTFLTLAMLVVGGMRSLAGAVMGVVVLSLVIEVFRRLERGVELFDVGIKLPVSSQEVVLGVIMVLILILRPSGIMGGKEITWPFRRAD